MPSSRTFFFSVQLVELPASSNQETGAAPTARSVVVAIDSTRLQALMHGGFAQTTARQIAEEMAEQAALHAVQKDFPHGFLPVCLATPLNRLPAELRQRSPTLHTREATAWLLEVDPAPSRQR